MKLILKIAFGSILLLPSVTTAEPLLIDKAKGAVDLHDPQKGIGPAPKGKFLLLDHQQLVLEAGSSVIILYQNKAKKINGPQAITTGYKPGTQKANRTSTNNSWKSSSNVGSTSSLSLNKSSESPKSAPKALNNSGSQGGISPGKAANKQPTSKILHPVDGRPIIRLESVEVQCTACPKVKYEIFDLATQELVYQYDDKPAAKYTGPELAAGNYMIQHNERDYYFTVISEEIAKEVEKKLANREKIIKNFSPIEKLTNHAKMLYQDGFWSEAFYLVKDAYLKNPDAEEYKKLYLQYYDTSSVTK